MGQLFLPPEISPFFAVPPSLPPSFRMTKNARYLYSLLGARQIGHSPSSSCLAIVVRVIRGRGLVTTFGDEPLLALATMPSFLPLLCSQVKVSLGYFDTAGISQPKRTFLPFELRPTETETGRTEAGRCVLIRQALHVRNPAFPLDDRSLKSAIPAAHLFPPLFSTPTPHSSVQGRNKIPRLLSIPHEGGS